LDILITGTKRSPSVRRAWIEIQAWEDVTLRDMSPSVRRAWIEIISLGIYATAFLSPSVRRAWIEIHVQDGKLHLAKVALRKEGVD